MRSNFTPKGIQRFFSAVFSLLFILLLTVNPVSAQQIINSNLSTGATASEGTPAPAGFFWSEVQTGNGTAGVGVGVSDSLAMLDDFVMPAGSWTITKITVFAYSTGYTGTASPFTELRLRIYNSDPSVGPATPIFGDLTTNRLSASSSASMYRIFPGTPGTTRQIWKLEANINLPVNGGTYWLECQNAVQTGIVSNFMPPGTVTGTTTQPGNNGRRHDLSAGANPEWVYLLDGTSGDSLDFHFLVNYASGPCTGTPAPGNTISSLSSVCPGVFFDLSVSGTIEGTGVTYQWQSSPDGTTFTDIAGANGTTLNTSQSSTTTYRLAVTCAASGQTGFSAPVQVTLSSPMACYCVPPATNCTLDDEILNVTVGTINNTSTCNNDGYENFMNSVSPTDMMAGSIIPMSVQVGPGGTEYVGVWIDYDHSGSFDEAEFTALGSGNGVVINGNIQLPITALPGQTGMRIRVRYNTALTGADACLGYTYGETEDYLVNILAAPICSGTPNPGNTMSIVTNVCSDDVFTLSTSNNMNAVGMTYQWQSSVDGINFTDIAGATSQIYTTTQTVTTWYRMVATCAGVSGNSNSIQIAQKLPSECYCIPANSNCTQDQITNVTIATLNNTSGCSANGYEDYTATVAAPVLTKGESFPLSVSLLAGRNDFVGVWIDYDQSGTFEATEFLLLGNGNGVTITSNINIPLTATTGITRMRIRARRNVALTGPNACTTYNNSETEDYAVNIAVPPPCSGTPDPGNTVASVAGACAGVDFTLSTSNNINLSGLTYQWQASADGVNFTDISGANSFTYTTSQTVATYYRIVATCSGNVANSVALFVPMSALTECHCTPPTTNCNANDQITNVNFVTIDNTSTCSVNGYGDYSHTLPPADVMLGETYPISVTVSAGGTERVYAWIDFNQNGQYETTEFYSLGSGNGVTITSSITIPRTALPGATKMRIRLRWNTALTASDACLGYTYGETEDYALNLLAPPPCTGTPDPGNTVSTSPTICPGIDFELSTSNNINFSGMSFQWQASADGTTFTDITGATEMTYTTTQTTATWYRIVATCSNVSTPSTPIQITMNPLIDCHCTPPATNCNLDDAITAVVIGTLNNTSGCSANGYENYSATVTPVQLVLDSTYDMTVTVGPGGTEYVGVWIDYNHNGIYEDTEFSDIGSGNGSDVAGTVYIPANATLGFTKMRVRVRWNTALTGADACLGYTYGETEDYKVEITCRNPNVTADPAAATQQCGQSVSFQVSATGSGLTYRWQSRLTPTDNFADVTNNATFNGATTSTLTITRLTDAMNGSEYRAIASSCGVSDTSLPAVLTVSRIPGAVTPTSAAFCLGGSAQLTIAGDVPSQSTTVNFTSGNLGTAIPDDATLAGINHSISVSGLPANAVINKMKVKINATHTWVGDLVLVLKAPNGKILNLGYQLTGTGGAAATTGMVNTVFASDGSVLFKDGTNPYTGTFKADAYLPATETPNDAANNPTYPLPNVASGPTGYTPDVTSFNDLYSVGNGEWTLALYDYWADGNLPGQPINTLNDWSLEITYSTTQISVGTWSPAAGLYTNAGLTSTYTAGDLLHDVYASPTQSTDYTLVVQSTGCSSNPILIPVTVYSTPTAVISASPYTSLFPGLQTTLSAVVSNSSTPEVNYQWQYNGQDLAGGTNSTLTVGVDGIGTYSLELTDGNGCKGRSSNTVVITDSINNRQVFVSPNPSNSGIVTIRYYDKTLGQKSPMYVVIYDNKGARIYSKPFNVNLPFGAMQVDLSRMAKGIYQLDLVDGSGQRLQTTKIVVN